MKPEPLYIRPPQPIDYALAIWLETGSYNRKRSYSVCVHVFFLWQDRVNSWNSAYFLHKSKHAIFTVNVRGFHYQLLPVILAVQKQTVRLLDTANWYLLLSCIILFDSHNHKHTGL